MKRMVTPNSDSDELRSAPGSEEETTSAAAENASSEPTDAVATADEALETPDLEAGDAEEETPRQRQLDVQIEKVSDCERHITVTIPADEVERTIKEQLDELQESAAVPGFRPGHVPRKVLETRYRKDKGFQEQVRNRLVLESIDQVLSGDELTPISEPDFDLDAIVLPDDAPLRFEFDIEVRPEFELPDWKNITLKRKTYNIGDDAVDRMIERLLDSRATLEPVDGPAELGDYIEAELTIRDGDTVLNSSENERIRLRQVLTFHDGRIEDFGKALEGVKAGEKRTCEVKLTSEDRTVTAEFKVKAVKRLKLPELTPEFVESEFGMKDEEELRKLAADHIRSRAEYAARTELREQLTEALLQGADWELPPSLLRRQAEREVYRRALELQSSGYSAEEVRSYINAMRQRISEEVASSLREHFILERLAEEFGIEVTEQDYQVAILQLAMQQNQPPRRIRAQLEREGQMDILHNQIVEEKVIQKLLEEVTIEEVEAPVEEVLRTLSDESAVDLPVEKTKNDDEASDDQPQEESEESTEE
ncbi:MAG: trigger factor [Planctomycetota bacterium]|nr:MAG: trigger factor [Planctomycetota bacterium]